MRARCMRATTFISATRPRATSRTLGKLGEEMGFTAVVYPEQLLRGHHVSSSEIRQLITRREDGEGAGAAGTSVQHLLHSRPRARLRAQVHRPDDQPVALRRTGSGRRRLHYLAARRRGVL